MKNFVLDRTITRLCKADCKSPEGIAPSLVLPHGGGKRLAAFTLAEVLITLAIIGIVAALTIPNLIVSYEKKATATRVKKSFAELNQVIKLSEVENGPFNTWDFGTTGSTANTRRFMQEYILPYISGITECSEGRNFDCGMPVGGVGINYKLNNGTGLSILTDPDLRILYILISANINKGENALLGRDAFYFEALNGTILPVGWQDGISRDVILNDGYIKSDTPDRTYNYACRKEQREPIDGIVDLNRHGCTVLLYLDGWEFKDDYPW